MNLLKNINWNGKTFGYDLLMINDHGRNRFYEKSLAQARDRVVLDIGAGTGLLTVMAAQAGARRVYSFERDPQNHAVAKEFIKHSGFLDRIELLCEDFFEVDHRCWPHDPIDIIITETFANDCFIENFAYLVEHAESRLNLHREHRWVPGNIVLKMGLVDVTREREFDPGVALPDQYVVGIESAVQLYRDSFYNKHSEINMPVAQIPRIKIEQPRSIDSFRVDKDLVGYLKSVQYREKFNHSSMINPYIKVDWCLQDQDHAMHLNGCSSWRSIAFKVDPDGGHDFYFRFNPLTNSLVGTQF